MRKDMDMCYVMRRGHVGADMHLHTRSMVTLVVTEVCFLPPAWVVVEGGETRY